MNDLDILIHLTGLQSVEKYDIIYLYNSHMGSLYSTRMELNIDDLYCESCGDYDTEIDRGYYMELVNKYSQRAEKLRDDTMFIGTNVYNHIDIEDILDRYIRPNDPKYAECGDDCPRVEGLSLEDILTLNYPVECKMCALEDTLSDLLLFFS